MAGNSNNGVTMHRRTKLEPSRSLPLSQVNRRRLGGVRQPPQRAANRTFTTTPSHQNPYQSPKQQTIITNMSSKTSDRVYSSSSSDTENEDTNCPCCPAATTTKNDSTSATTPPTIVRSLVHAMLWLLVGFGAGYLSFYLWPTDINDALSHTFAPVSVLPASFELIQKMQRDNHLREQEIVALKSRLHSLEAAKGLRGGSTTQQEQQPDEKQVHLINRSEHDIQLYWVSDHQVDQDGHVEWVLLSDPTIAPDSTFHFHAQPSHGFAIRRKEQEGILTNEDHDTLSFIISDTTDQYVIVDNQWRIHDTVTSDATENDMLLLRQS